MTNQYQILKNKQQKEFNAFPMGAAFSEKQFAEMMAKWDLLPTDTDKILHIGGGCYIRKNDREAFHELVDRLDREKKEAIAADTTGDGIIKDMFLYELANHEYCITYDLEDTLDALGLTVDEINANPRLLRGLEKALTQYLKDAKDY